MKYEYGVEYETNGEKPDLPDDVLIQQFHNGAWVGELCRWAPIAKPVSDWMLWNNVTKFRIVDERYKPKEREEMSELKLGDFYSLNELSKIDGAFDEGNYYLYVGESDGVYFSGKVYPTNGRGIVDEYDEGNHTSFCNHGGVTPDFQLVVLVNSQLEDVNKNDWYKKGEFPPVGEVCILASVGFTELNHEVEITYIGDGVGCYKRLNDSEEFTFASSEVVFRPLRTEADKLVEQMMFHGCQSLNRKQATELIEQGYRKIKPMSEQEFMKQCLDICGHGDTRLYRAGCRFIEQVKV